MHYKSSFEEIKAAVLYLEGLVCCALFIRHGGIKKECYRVLLCRFRSMQQAAKNG